MSDPLAVVGPKSVELQIHLHKVATMAKVTVTPNLHVEPAFLETFAGMLPIPRAQTLDQSESVSARSDQDPSYKTKVLVIDVWAAPDFPCPEEQNGFEEAAHRCLKWALGYFAKDPM